MPDASSAGRLSNSAILLVVAINEESKTRSRDTTWAKQNSSASKAHSSCNCLLLQLSADNQREAETGFQHAMTIAQKQGAKAWELRTVTSLARLWQHKGKRQEARDLLAPVYTWFTEGFETPDLQEAKALLAEL